MGTQAVQGGGVTTLATYTDPAAPPGATINQLLPSSNPQVAADQQQAYAALVQAAKNLLGNSVSFNDFLNVNLGTTITPQALLGLGGDPPLQDAAYNLVTQNYYHYLNTATPSQGLLAALDDVHSLLDTVNSLRKNVFLFVQAQDSWIHTEIDNILGAGTLGNIANTIVINQSKDNPPPYLEPPPDTASDMGANVGIQVGQQVLGFLTTVVAPLLFPESLPLVGAVGELLNLGATVGATYGEAALSNSTAQMPTLVVPQDKNDKATLVDVATAFQNQMIAGLNAQQNLENEPLFYYPLFSNVGLLRALANLNPLVLDSKSSGDQLGPNNPTAAAVNYAAWKALLPTYFQWVPIDPTKESQTQNFNNFYPGATPASAGDAAKQLEAMQLEAVKVLSWGDGSGVPTSGNSLVIVGIDNNGLLHIRIFDAGGNEVTDTDETKLPSSQAGAIATLKQQIPGLLPPHVLTGADMTQIINEATSIVGQDPPGEYPGFTDPVPNDPFFGSAPPTPMGNFPADNTSGGETDHPERFFALTEANLTEKADLQNYIYNNNGSEWVDWGDRYVYARDGLYVSGWKLVDANGVEIDPRTAAEVFPAAGSPIQPATGDPKFVAFGGGWYLNVAPPPLTSSGSNNATQATWMDVYANWFHQSSLMPPSPVSGSLNYGTYQAGDVWVGNPRYSVSFYPINDPVPPSFPFDNIADRGFEQGQVGYGQQQYRPTGSPWTFSSYAGIAGNGSSFTGGNGYAPEGTQVAFLQETGAFSQTVPGWAAGSYEITFKAAQRLGSQYFQPAQEDFKVLVDGNVVGTITPSGTSYQSYTTGPFTVTAGSHKIMFQGVDTAGGDNTALIDQVVLVEVAGQPPIADQGFEQVSVVGAGGYQYDPTGAAWTFSGQSGIAAIGSNFTAGEPSVPEGLQVAFLQETGSFSQSVAGWAAGSYQLTFRAAQPPRRQPSGSRRSADWQRPDSVRHAADLVAARRQGQRRTPGPRRDSRSTVGLSGLGWTRRVS
jgi:hypothetical protein